MHIAHLNSGALANILLLPLTPWTKKTYSNTNTIKTRASPHILNPGFAGKSPYHSAPTSETISRWVIIATRQKRPLVILLSQPSSSSLERAITLRGHGGSQYCPGGDRKRERRFVPSSSGFGTDQELSLHDSGKSRETGLFKGLQWRDTRREERTVSRRSIRKSRSQNTEPAANWGFISVVDLPCSLLGRREWPTEQTPNEPQGTITPWTPPDQSLNNPSDSIYYSNFLSIEPDSRTSIKPSSW